ncbi:DNA helicase RecQ [Vagococcus jeotgali]|uniref:DNA helicase RecQ n=1 Tax=Vagococcus jeotgali TaxID=3109030 RepID=UPI002DD86A11|nr:DNA helicase RecQ [Vagococcus sp. B2T-5]
MEKIYQCLEEVFGYTTFRAGQEDIIRYINQGENVLGIMPTGGGKSVCYQLPAVMSSDLTLVVSPLISLMKDQVDALNDMGISATYINSTLDYQEINHRLRQVLYGDIKLLYVAPERLSSAEFIQQLNQRQIGLIAIDEAHCISQWGHDFRPSYLDLAENLKYFSNQPTIVALTATATEEVAQDICQLLHIPKSNRVQTGFARENLSFQLFKDQHDNYLLEYLKTNKGQSGIIYATTRKEVERLYRLIKHAGLSVGMYHGGLSETQRSKNQEDFIYDQTQVMIATNAFGMGIDKSNVRFVIHAQLPGNIESYYQEAGRAGRDGLPSDAILLYAPQDIQIQHYFIEQSTGEAEYKQHEYEKLREMNQYAHTQMCLQQYILRYFGENGVACGHCSNCLDDREVVDITKDAQKVLSCVKRMGEKFGKGLIGKVLIGSKDQKITQWQFDKLSTYGLLSDMTQKEVVDLIDFLTAEQLLVPTKDQYPVLLVSENGIDVLLGKKQVFRKQLAVKQLMKADELFESLRLLRSDLATKQNLPPYVVFSDKTLQDLVDKVPTTSIEFLQIKGVGQNKLDKYGEDFMRVIKQHLEMQGHAN